MTKNPNVSKPVRSFVRREGRMTNAQKKAIEELKDKYGIDGAEKISDGYPFAKGTDIHLEIGFGDGEALMSLAKSNLESGFIGIDPHRPGAGRGRSLHRRRGVRRTTLHAPFERPSPL